MRASIVRTYHIEKRLEPFNGMPYSDNQPRFGKPDSEIDQIGRFHVPMCIDRCKKTIMEDNECGYPLYAQNFITECKCLANK